MPAAYDHNSATDLSFPQKLYNIVLQEPAVFKWNCGHDELADSFRIIDEDALVHRILQQHFRTNRFSSFTRNLNIYGFKKIAKGEFAGSYYHPEFKKGGQAAVMRLRRCVRKTTNMETAIKVEPEIETRKQKNIGKRSAAPVVVNLRVNGEASATCAPEKDDGRTSPMGSCDGSFWNEGTFDMEHELALPVLPDSECSNFPADASVCCLTPTHNLMEDDLVEDTDLAEWKKVLCFTSNNCPTLDASPWMQPQQPANNGANAYAVHVPAGPLGATLECQGNKVFLSKVDNRNSPLAHVPAGAQLVNMDGKDTTQMAVGQISKLDQLTCHRNRMVIFTLVQCWDTALLAMTPTVPQHASDWEAPKAKSMHTDDVSMSTDTYSSPSSHNNSSGWLQCLYEAM